MVYAIIGYIVHKCANGRTTSKEGAFLAAYQSAAEVSQVLASENEANRRLRDAEETSFLLRQANSPREENLSFRWVEKRLAGLYLCPKRALIAFYPERYVISEFAASNLREAQIDRRWCCPPGCTHDH